MRTGLWSLPPSCIGTIGVAFLGISLVVNASSSVVEVSHRLEKKVGGSSVLLSIWTQDT